MDDLPASLYRVQHDRSYTHYDSVNGFSSQGHYLMANSFWLNKQKLESHLIWEARPIEPTPFISAFGNLADAKKRVQFHRSGRHTGIFLAEIDTSSLRPTSLDIEFEDRLVQLPAWVNERGVTFISAMAVCQYLQVDSKLTDKSEWFALDYVPGDMITVRHIHE